MGDRFSRGPYRLQGPLPNQCSEAVKGVREQCCYHDLPDNHKHAPGSVCCWCGDIYLPEYTPTSEHSPYKPKFLTGWERAQALLKKSPKTKSKRAGRR